MELKIVKNKENNLLARREVEFSIRHDGATTPSRVQARQLLASELGTKTENVVIAEMGSEYGVGATYGYARAYKSADAARSQERVHFLKRNALYIEKVKKGDKKDEKKGA
jgi:small subunit ribosomal protein S24e